jgi:hypothetical protein
LLCCGDGMMLVWFVFVVCCMYGLWLRVLLGVWWVFGFVVVWVCLYGLGCFLVCVLWCCVDFLCYGLGWCNGYFLG